MPASPDAIEGTPREATGAATTQNPTHDVLASLADRGIRLGTETVKTTLAALGDPHRTFDSVLVTGTNGKGSSARMIAEILARAGRTTGLFTSPALERVGEQIRTATPASAGRFAWIDDLALATALERAVRVAEDLRAGDITAFEAMTIASFVHFADCGVQSAVLEAGLGGARDATNVVDADASLLVSVGHDHSAFLGEDLASIAREKAGTFRADRPAIVGWLEADAEAAVREAALECGARTRFARTCIRSLATTSRGLDPQTVVVETTRDRYQFDLSMLGEHQAQNAALAVLTAEALEIGRAPIESALVSCRWAGRLEPIKLPGSATLLIDAAHNIAGAQSLARFLAGLDRPFSLVFGAFGDKDAAGMLTRLTPSAERVSLARIDGPRSFDPHAVAPTIPGASVHESVEDALDTMLSSVGRDALVVACGSLRVVAAARRVARERRSR